MDLRTTNVCPRCGKRVERPHEAPWAHRDKTTCTWPAPLEPAALPTPSQLTFPEAA